MESKFRGSCFNCQANILIGEFCRLCALKRECNRCRRRLDAHSFDGGNTCISCCRRRRTAVYDVFQEIDLPTSSNLITFPEFGMLNNETIHVDINNALEEHR